MPASNSAHIPMSGQQPSDSSKLARREFLKRSCLTLPALSAPWFTACGSDVLAPTPKLASVDNFRDVAGPDNATAYRTASGQKLRRGVIYRSNALAAPSTQDLATLKGLGIHTIFDLRTPGEISEHPDVPPAGATETNVNLNGTPNAVTPTLTSAEEAIAYMESSYETFVNDSGVCGRLAEVLYGIATTPGRHLYHCSGGKDRTGWTTATLLSIVGVPQDVIIQDYLLTNVYTQASIQDSYQQTVTNLGQAAADIVFPILVADERYIYAALNQVTALFGSMAAYISTGLGLNAATQSALRAMLLQ